SKLKVRDYDSAFNLSDQWRAAIISKLSARCSVGLDCIKRDGYWWRFCNYFINHELVTSHHIVENQLNIHAPLIQPKYV
ncbi:glycosyltransferase family 9 protein, partial [Neisseria sp. P0013.S005]|uniref:glycosyltransferase family 9 protein n=1 Tax=Neisseria sp. P0013.S005 TaxID=3436741 RepID=UPI003F810603